MQPVEEKELHLKFSKIVNTIRIQTLGCRLNQIESESIGRLFIEKGFSVSMEVVTSQSDEDFNTVLCIVNTCTVTQKSEQKARRLIRLLLKKYPESAIIVTGCYAQLAPKEISEIDSRIAVVGGQIKSRLEKVPELLFSELEKSSFNKINFVSIINDQISLAPNEKKDFPENSFILSTSSFINHSRASLKIQDGCNNNCSYCAIHIARGHSVSIDVKTAVDRVKLLEKNGQDEVVITTVNIGQYKSEYLGKIYNFAKLLKLMLECTNRINFRISSLYPEIVDDEFCEVIKNPRVRPHFHISVQSGSNKILGAMNRVYKAETVLNACRKLSEVKDKPFLACDIITGFPGETEEDFEQTMKLCQECNFSWVHAFPYSERPGTIAASMKNKVPQSVSGERAKKLTDWAIQQKIDYVNFFAGKEVPAILETVRRPSVLVKNSQKIIYHAVTENFIHCEIVSEKKLESNKAINVKIIKALEERIVKGGEIEAQGMI